MDNINESQKNTDALKIKQKIEKQRYSFYKKQILIMFFWILLIVIILMIPSFLFNSFNVNYFLYPFLFCVCFLTYFLIKKDKINENDIIKKLTSEEKNILENYNKKTLEESIKKQGGKDNKNSELFDFIGLIMVILLALFIILFIIFLIVKFIKFVWFI